MPAPEARAAVHAANPQYPARARPLPDAIPARRGFSSRQDRHGLHETGRGVCRQGSSSHPRAGAQDAVWHRARHRESRRRDDPAPSANHHRSPAHGRVRTAPPTQDSIRWGGNEAVIPGDFVRPDANASGQRHSAALRSARLYEIRTSKKLPRAAGCNMARTAYRELPTDEVVGKTQRHGARFTVGREATMVRLVQGQRTIFGEKFFELGNYAAAALVFGQFVGQQAVSWRVVVAGVATWCAFAVLSFLLTGER